MSCEGPKEQLFAELERVIESFSARVIDRHYKGDDLTLGKRATPSSVPSGTIDYMAAEAMCLECARLVVGKILALVDGIAEVDDGSVVVKILTRDGEDLSGDLLNEYQLYYFRMVEPPDHKRPDE